MGNYNKKFFKDSIKFLKSEMSFMMQDYKLLENLGVWNSISPSLTFPNQSQGIIADEITIE